MTVGSEAQPASGNIKIPTGQKIIIIKNLQSNIFLKVLGGMQP